MPWGTISPNSINSPRIWLLDEHERGKPSAATETSIVAIVTETARGVQYLPEFRGRLPRLQGLMWGAEDLCADLGGTANRSAGRGDLMH